MDLALATAPPAGFRRGKLFQLRLTPVQYTLPWSGHGSKGQPQPRKFSNARAIHDCISLCEHSDGFFLVWLPRAKETRQGIQAFLFLIGDAAVFRFFVMFKARRYWNFLAVDSSRDASAGAFTGCNGNRHGRFPSSGGCSCTLKGRNAPQRDLLPSSIFLEEFHKPNPD